MRTPMSDGQTSRVPLRSATRLGPTGRTVALWGTGVLAGLAMAIIPVVGLRAADSGAAELRARSLPVVAALSEAARATATGQDAFVDAIETQDPAVRAAAITTAEAAGRTQDEQWSRYLSLAGDGADERALQSSYETSASLARQLAASVFSLAADDPTRAEVFAEERRESDEALAALIALEQSVYGPMTNEHAVVVEDGIHDTRTAVLASSAVLIVLFSAIAFVLLRGARRDQRMFNSEATELRLAGEQADLEGSLQRGLEMAPTEDATYEVVAQALSMVAADVPTELLLAESSHAHFRQVLSTGDEDDAACRAGAPRDCPAAKSGQARTFSDSTEIDACRFLRGRDGPVWAVCVPVSVGGRATGVVHAQRSLDRPLPDRLATGLELVARKTGERIGALRVLARTEAEAQVDPLTGLPNRRTLENQVQELRILDAPYVVAFADLDHFKAINDTHGHDMGDRALRLFARVLRDSIRPRDLLARHGGEEFVAVLPDCSLADAGLVAERIRSALARALDHAPVPPFTVTVGLAAAAPGDLLSAVTANADAAMLLAKSQGRDRVLVASEVGAGAGE